MDQILDRKQRWSPGYQRFSLMDRVIDLGLSSAFEALVSLFPTLQVDPYDPTGCRFRAYGRGAYYPWRNAFEWFPDEEDGLNLVSRYYQGEHNPEHVDAWREFTALPAAMKRNPVLSEIVTNAAMRAYFNEHNYVRPIGVGVHLIRQHVDENNLTATVSPRVMHQDGEMFDYVYLIERKGVVGGANIVGEISAAGMDPENVPQELTFEKFTLEAPLEGFGVFDASVSHGVEPVTLAPESTEGFRHTVLVDLTPMYEQLR